jgi:hypothetical protein
MLHHMQHIVTLQRLIGGSSMDVQASDDMCVLPFLCHARTDLLDAARTIVQRRVEHRTHPAVSAVSCKLGCVHALHEFEHGHVVGEPR